MASIPPGTILLLGALVLPLIRGRFRSVWLLALPITSFVHLLGDFSSNSTVAFQFFDFELTPIRIDALSLVWGYVFHIAAILGVIYSLHVKDNVQAVTSLVYAAASMGAVFAGDLLTLFVYWELTAITSVFLVWSGNTKQSFGAGMRYAIMHVGSGVLVLSGTLLIYRTTGSLSFGTPEQYGMFHELGDWGTRLLLVGFGVKAAFPLVHCWLPDAYPESTPSGTVFLSAFTTKMAIYALARGFAGAEVLVVIGIVMVIFPLVYAILADDLRRTLAHVLNNQLGFMVVGIGIGSSLAIDGVAAMAFAHVIYKGLLFMATGAILFQTGTARQSQLGGLASKMPWTCAFCLVGALSVVPLNCGFVTKSLVVSAAADEHMTVVWMVLMTGAVGAFLTAGIKVPYFAFFHGKPSRDVTEAPNHMLIAMGMSAALCLGIGIAPGLLYRLLPHQTAYHAYTFAHVVNQLQLLTFATLGFALLHRVGLTRTSPRVIDVDWIYRKPIPALLRRVRVGLQGWDFGPRLQVWWRQGWAVLAKQSSESGVLGRSVSTNAMAFFAIVLLGVYLLIYYR